jgi:TolB-like protein
MRLLSAFTGFLIAVMLSASFAAGDPATQPAPSTQPAATDLYLIPFSALGGDTSLDWAGKAVQQNLLTDLARAKLNVVAADKPIEDTKDARTAARAAGAKFIITGTYQVADTLVRFTGQILETETGKVLGGLSATGAPRDLFTMEDALSAQAIQALAKLTVAVNNKPAAPVPPALQPAVVVQVIQPPAVAQNGTSSSYQGSALQQYVDSNRTPSTDYNQQAQDADDRDTFGYGYNNPGSIYFGSYGGFGYGYSYGLYYTIPSGGFHHGIEHRKNDDR